MRLIALMTVRNEDWVIGLSLRAALTWCDEAIVLNHASTDRTPVIVRQVAEETGRVTILHEPNPAWAEMSHRQWTLDEARKRGATHCAIIDADEVLSANLRHTARQTIQAMSPGGLIQVPMRNMWRSLQKYRCDRSAFGNAICTLAFAMSDRLSWHDDNGYPHHHREPYGHAKVIARTYPHEVEGGIMHLQFASWRRLIAKHALYKMSERIRFPNKSIAEIDRMYSMAPDEGGLTVATAEKSWWEPYREFMHYLDVDAEPWQETECRRLLAEHSFMAFQGLNLFGVV